MGAEQPIKGALVALCNHRQWKGECDRCRISELEAALRKIVAGPGGAHEHESGCPFEKFACGVAYEALPKSTPVT